MCCRELHLVKDDLAVMTEILDSTSHFERLRSPSSCLLRTAQRWRAVLHVDACSVKHEVRAPLVTSVAFDGIGTVRVVRAFRRL